MAVVWSSTPGISYESWFAAFALVSLGIMLTVDTESIFLVALAGVSVAFALLTQTQIEATSGTRVTRSAILARCSYVAWRALTLFDL